MGLRGHNRVHRKGYRRPNPWLKILRAVNEGRSSLQLTKQDLQFLISQPNDTGEGEGKH